MKTQTNHHYKAKVGDTCDVHPGQTSEQHLIEGHAQKMIAGESSDVIMAAAPVRKRSNWFGWCLGALAALLVGVGAIFYFTSLHKGDKEKPYVAKTMRLPDLKVTATEQGDEMISALILTNSGTGARANVAAAAPAATADDYIYYFGNDQSDVSDNQTLDKVAASVRQNNDDVVVTAYASAVGSTAYNEKLCERRAEEVADYLVAHGVPRDHIKTVSGGESTRFGDYAHNRFANIHIIHHS